VELKREQFTGRRDPANGFASAPQELPFWWFTNFRSNWKRTLRILIGGQLPSRLRSQGGLLESTNGRNLLDDVVTHRASLVLTHSARDIFKALDQDIKQRSCQFI